MSFFCTDKNSFDAENLTYTIKESGKNNIVDRKYKHVHVDEDGDESEVYARDNHKMKLRLVVAFKSDETKEIIVHDRNAEDPEEDIRVEMQKYDLKFEFTDEADLKIMENRRDSDITFITENAVQIFGKKVSADAIQKNFNAKFKEEENYKTKEKYMGLTAVVMFPVPGTPKEHVDLVSYRSTRFYDKKRNEISFNPGMFKNGSEYDVVIEFPYDWFMSNKMMGLQNRVSCFRVTKSSIQHDRNVCPFSDDEGGAAEDDLPDDSEGEFEESS